MTIEKFIEARLGELEEAASLTLEMEQKWTADGYSCEYQWVKMVVKPDGNRSGSYTFESGSPSPAEVLRQVAAWRAVLAFGAGLTSASQQVEFETDVLVPLAASWAEHPDYPQGWAP